MTELPTWCRGGKHAQPSCASMTQREESQGDGVRILAKQTRIVMATQEKPLMVVAIDDSEHSLYTLEWTLDRFFAPFGSNPPFKLVIVHAKPSPIPAVSLAGLGAAEIIQSVETDLIKIADRVIDKAKKICIAKSVHDVLLEVMEGDARNVLCDSVEKHHASLLVVGSHGYGSIKRAVLGSVSDHCAHHAHCTVMIVKTPKPIKH